MRCLWGCVFLMGCADTGNEGAKKKEDTGAAEPTGLAILGHDAHTTDDLQIEVMVDANAGLAIPRAIEFHPDIPGQAWIANRATHSITVVDNISAQATAQTSNGYWNQHFLAQPSDLSFGDNGYFATIHETDDYTQGNATPQDFMGPTLWSSDVNQFEGGHASHMDMLHNSPNGMGIEWEAGTAYWVFDGYHSSLTRYDFKDDHGPGGADHSDAVVHRYVEGQVMWVEDVPSHMVMDHTNGLLYVADTGNNRIAVLDISTGTEGFNVTPNYDGIRTQRYMHDADLWTFIDGTKIDGMVHPSGLQIDGGVLYVSDNSTGRIFGFSMEGELLDWVKLDVDEGALMGIDFDPSTGDLYFVDALQEQVSRVVAPESAEAATQ